MAALMAHGELHDEGQASQEGQNATFQNVKEPQISNCTVKKTPLRYQVISKSFLMERKSNDDPASSGNEAQRTEASTSVLSDQLLKYKAVPGSHLSFTCSTENRSCSYGSGPDNTCHVEGEAAAAVEELPSCTDRRCQRQFSGVWFFLALIFFQTNKAQALS